MNLEPMIDIYVGGVKKFHKDYLADIFETSYYDQKVENIYIGLAYAEFILPSKNDIYIIINHRCDSHYPELSQYIVQQTHKKYGHLIKGYVYAPSQIQIKNYGIQKEIANISAIENICNSYKKEHKLFVYPQILKGHFSTEILLEYAKNNMFGTLIGSPYKSYTEVIDSIQHYNIFPSDKTIILSSSTLSESQNIKNGYKTCISITNLSK